MKLIYKILVKLSVKNNFLLFLAQRYISFYNNDNNIFQDLNGELFIAKKILKKSKIVFDIGANIGCWTKMALKINKDLEIHCFEPSNEIYNKLKKNIFEKNVLLNNLGISSKIGMKTLYMYAGDSGLSSLYDRSVNSLKKIKTEKVYLTTIDDYCKKNKIKSIDYVKIDVEGHELEVMKGMVNILKSKKIKYIQFEYGGAYIDSGIFLKDVFQFFICLGYKIYKIFPKEVKLIDKYDQRYENFQYSNWMAVRVNLDLKLL